MPTVRLRQEEEFADPTTRNYLEGIRKWFDIDYVPQMVLAQSMHSRFQGPHEHFKKRTMPDGALKRSTKEMVAVAVSTINACEY